MATHPLRTQWGRIWLPYCFYKLDLPGHVYLPVNRDYKPLGFITFNSVGISVGETWVDYELYVEKAMVFAKDPHGILGVFVNDNLYLYDNKYEKTIMDSYFARYEKLLSRQVGIFEQLE